MNTKQRQTMRAICVIIVLVVQLFHPLYLNFAYAKAEDETITVYVTTYGTKYHRHGCGYLSRSCHELSLKRAISMGYSPCSRCHPPTLAGKHSEDTSIREFQNEGTSTDTSKKTATKRSGLSLTFLMGIAIFIWFCVSSLRQGSTIQGSVSQPKQPTYRQTTVEELFLSKEAPLPQIQLQKPTKPKPQTEKPSWEEYRKKLLLGYDEKFLVRMEDISIQDLYRLVSSKDTKMARRCLKHFCKSDVDNICTKQPSADRCSCPVFGYEPDCPLKHEE